MVESQNKEVTLVTKASHLTGIASYGNVMIGDKAFEFYNERKVTDYIQIPWKEIDYISVSVVLNKWVNRFIIFTKSSGHYTFSTKNNKATLREVRKYFPESKMYRSETIYSFFKKKFSKKKK